MVGGSAGSAVRPRGTVIDPLAVAILAAAVSLLGAGRPSFWYDEAATISASYSRSVAQLWQMLDHVDAVHGLYYLLMHGWFVIFPPTECWARVPSGLAVGAAAAGLTVLARRFASRTVALCAGAVCAILPRSTWAGIEARPYALSMAAAAWLTVLFVVAVRRNGGWWWLAYAAALAISVLLDVYLTLMAPAHAVFLVVHRPARAVVLRFALAVVGAAVAAAPFVVKTVGQTHQIVWIAPVGRRTVEDVLVQQYFERCPPFLIISSVLVLAAIAVWWFTARRASAGERRLLTLAIGWLAVPTALIVGWSALVHPIYTPRYLCFTAPAVALLLGVCIGAIAVSPWLATAAVTVLAIAAAPNYLAVQRSPYAKYGMDYSQVADLISARAAPGDCLLVNDTVTFHPAPMRPLLAARPDAYRPLVDLSLWQKATDRNDVFDTNLIPEASAGPLGHCHVVWIITQADPQAPAHQRGSAIAPGPLFGGTPAFWVSRDRGFALQERWQFNLVQVIRATR